MIEYTRIGLTGYSRKDGRLRIKRKVNRPKCNIEGCDNIVTTKGWNRQGSKKRYRKLCSTHYRLKQGKIFKIDTSKCSICNWLGFCDKHRIMLGRDGGKYKQGNVIVLCPNCHRLLHMGKLTLR